MHGFSITASNSCPRITSNPVSNSIALSDFITTGPYDVGDTWPVEEINPIAL